MSSLIQLDNIQTLKTKYEIHQQWQKWLDECILFLQMQSKQSFNYQERFDIVHKTWLLNFDLLNETLTNTISCTDIGFVLLCLLKICKYKELRETNITLYQICDIHAFIQLSHINHVDSLLYTFPIVESGTIIENASESYNRKNKKGEQVIFKSKNIINNEILNELKKQINYFRINQKQQEKLFDLIAQWLYHYTPIKSIFETVYNQNQNQNPNQLSDHNSYIQLLRLQRDEREQDENFALYATSQSFLFQQNSQILENTFIFKCSRLFHHWNFINYILYEYKHGTKIYTINETNLKFIIGASSIGRLENMIKHYSTIQIGERFFIYFRNTLLDLLLPCGARRSRFRMQSSRLAKIKPLTLLSNEYGNVIAAQLGAYVNVPPIDIISSDQEQHSPHAKWMYPWLVLCMFAYIYDQYMNTTNFLQEYFISESMLFDQREWLIETTKHEFRPRRPIICHINNEWYVQTINSMNNELLWYKCSNSAHSILIWLKIIQIKYNNQLSNGQSHEYWINKFEMFNI